MITASDFKIQTFISNHSKKEVLNFIFDVVLFTPFRETHRVKGCDKNFSLFLILRRKVACLGVPKRKYMILNGYNFFKYP